MLVRNKGLDTLYERLYEKKSSEILSEFIDKIVVHHREQFFGEAVEKVEIYYKMIGFMELPNMSQYEKENYIKCFSRKKEDRGA